MKQNTSFHFTRQPFAHQYEALERAWSLPAFAYFLEQGTGKSKIIVDEIVNLIERDMIDCAVVLAPNQVHENWFEEFIKDGPPNYDKWTIQVYKSKANREKQEAKTKEIIASGKRLIFLMNIEALSSEYGQKFLYRVLANPNRRTYFVIDESHKIKSYSAIRTKMAIKIGTFARYRRIATGTEAQEGLHNLYAQFRFLDWNIIGLKSFTAFRNMYCIMGGFENRQILGYQNKEILAARIAPYIYSKRKAECLDLPEKLYVEHYIEMTPQQQRLYKSLEDELLLEIDNKVIDGTLAITKLIRLQQILAGHIENKGIDSNRAAFVAELVDAASGKVIVFTRFVKDVELCLVELAQMKIGAIGITGDTTDRLDHINKWRENHKIKALVITTQTGGTGLTLNEANTTIFYNNHWSSTDRLQAEDRNHRVGQKQKVTYHDVIVKGKLDHKILKALQKKTNLADEFRMLLADGRMDDIRDILGVR